LRRFVLDASVVIRWFGPQTAAATALRSEFEAGRLAVTVPTLLFLELVNVAGRQWRWREDMLQDLARELEGAKFEALNPQLDRVAAWVSRGLTAYDASYVALAEQLDFPLVTEDSAILEVARDVAITLGDVPQGR
jgi:predicted nucleic acid-binding protein